MVISRKKWIIILLLVLLLVLVSVFLYFRNRVYWPYDDGWMIGKSRAEIVQRYGEFDDSILGADKEVYRIRDNPLAPIYDGDKGYFVMAFDNEGKCVKVYRYVPPAM